MLFKKPLPLNMLVRMQPISVIVNKTAGIFANTSGNRGCIDYRSCNHHSNLEKKRTFCMLHCCSANKNINYEFNQSSLSCHDANIMCQLDTARSILSHDMNAEALH